MLHNFFIFIAQYANAGTSSSVHPQKYKHTDKPKAPSVLRNAHFTGGRHKLISAARFGTQTRRRRKAIHSQFDAKFIASYFSCLAEFWGLSGQFHRALLGRGFAEICGSVGRHRDIDGRHGGGAAGGVFRPIGRPEKKQKNSFQLGNRNQ